MRECLGQHTATQLLKVNDMGGFEEKVALVIPIIEEEARLNACFDADAWDNMAKNTRDRYIFSYLLEKYTADTEHLDKKIQRLQAENERLKEVAEAIGCTYAVLCTYAMNGKDITEIEFPEIADTVLKALEQNTIRE